MVWRREKESREGASSVSKYLQMGVRGRVAGWMNAAIRRVASSQND